MTIVVDASVAVAALIDSGSAGDWAEGIIARNGLVAPELLLIETTNVLRRLERNGDIATYEAISAQRDLMLLDIDLFPFAPFASRVWELRNNLTSYDASYVAVAEAFDAPLATLDRKLAQGGGARCEFVVP